MIKHIVFASFIVYLFFSAGQVTAQDDEFTRALRQYTLQLEIYRDAREEYILKRSQYLNFQTQRSRQEAFNATLDMLQKRDEVVITYLKALQIRLDEAIGVPEEREISIDSEIDVEIAWFEDHKQRLTSATDLDDLVADSDEAKERYELMHPLIYEGLATVSYGRVVDFDERLREIYSLLDLKVEEIRNDQREGYSFSPQRFEIIDRWMAESENRLVRAEERIAETENTLRFVPERSRRRFEVRNVVSHYNDNIQRLNDAQLTMGESINVLQEVTNLIKIAEE